MESQMSNKYTWHFIQPGGLVQLKINTIEDILNLKYLDQKLWIALACPVKGLEFSEETLSLLDTDHNGRVRIPEILDAVEFIKKYFKKPEVIMTEGSTLPLDSLSSEAFSCGHSPIESAKSILHILGKDDQNELTLEDLSINNKLFAPSVINGDGILPAEAVDDQVAAGVIKDIVACTGGSDDISGSKGCSRKQFEAFFSDLKEIKNWRDNIQTENGLKEKIFFLKDSSDAAFHFYTKVKDKIDDYFFRCSINSYDNSVAKAIQEKEEEEASVNGLSCEQLKELPLALCSENGSLNLEKGINPAWKDDIENFVKNVTEPIFGQAKSELLEIEWKKIEDAFAPYQNWYKARPENTAASLSIDRVNEILASGAEEKIASYLDKEESHPPLALATVDLKKMLLLRRDFVKLLRNYVSFEDFYSFDEKAVFQCGTLYIDGRSCDLCFRVLDGTKHASMSPLSQCYLLYCECKRPSTNESMQIAALVSAGNCDNLIVGRNGLFYDCSGKDWDATITKIVDNPISIKEAFFSPYKKLARMIQERIAKKAAEAESKVTTKMQTAVEKPKETAAGAQGKRFDVGTIAALGVAISGIAAVIGSVLGIITKTWWMPPVFIIGLLLIISLPSMLLAWLKLRQRNIAPILDASGWAVNGNVRINIPLGRVLTKTGIRPRGSKLETFDPYAQKKFPVKRLILAVLILVLIVCAVLVIAKNDWNAVKAWKNTSSAIVSFFKKLTDSAAAK